jgi:hypothetical protein
MSDLYREACERHAQILRELEEEEELQQAMQPQQQRSNEGLVYKTFHNDTPVQQQRGMGEATEREWNLWCDRKIENALHNFLKDILVPIVGDALGETRIDMRENFEKQLGELRSEIETLRKGNNVELIRKGQRDVA